MPTWPLADGFARVAGTTHSTTDSTNGAVTVTAAASTDTKGSYVELISSTVGPSHLLVLEVSDSFVSGAATNCLLDIAIGAASSEVVVVTNVPVGYAGQRAAGGSRIIPIPVYVPSGSRVAVRMQSSVASRTALIGAYLVGSGPIAMARQSATVDTLGADTATSRGVAVSAGSANTKGSWVEITASTTAVYSGLVVCHSANSASMFGRSHLVDVGVGPAGSETVIVADLQYVDDSSERVYQITPSPLVMFDTPIPAGSRLAVRKQSSAASDTTTDIVLLGIRR